MSNSDQSTGYLGSLIAGFVSLSIFGIASMVVFFLFGMKSPTDRTFEGDFSAKRVAMRSSLLETVTAEQASTVDQARLEAAMSEMKAAPPAASSIAFPGSATAIEAMKPKPPAALPKPKAEPKPKPKPVVEDAPKAPAAAKGGQKGGKAAPKGKGNAPKAAAPKANAKGKGKAKSNGKAKAKAGQKGKGKSNPKAKAPEAAAPQGA